MTPSFIFNYIKRCHSSLKELATQQNVSLMYLWFDFAKCSVAHKAILNHYTRGKLYKSKGCERKKSLTYGRIVDTINRCNSREFIPVLNNKHLFNRHFSAYVNRRWLYSKEMTPEQFADLCNSFDKLIVKPEDGLEGMGVRKIQAPKTPEQQKALFDELSKTPAMIEECIIQHPGMIFNNTSVNTIRAHSIIDRNGKVHLFKTLLRAGVGDSVVDNYAHGGCAYEVDITTGRIISPSLQKNGGEIYIHPGTDMFMLGRQIPNWESVLDGVAKAHQLLPQCRFIGWDVAVTPTGIELIEGNHNPDYELIEFFGSTGWYEKIKPYI